MADIRRISIGYGKQARKLIVEFPGGMAHITTGLRNAHGRDVVHVSASADGDRYGGNPEFWAICDKPGVTGMGCRIVQATKKELRKFRGGSQ